MSQYKKKKMKQPTRLRTLVASLMLIAPALHAANNTEFSSRPLVGVSASFAPHIALALSVEFPTAGPAYSDNNFLSVTGASDSSPITQTYLGYFDNTKCYKYEHSKGNNGYFFPNSKAKTENGNYGLCNNDGETEEFSGNLLNFMTMTAVDIFRQTMTGGNRAYGRANNAENYSNGDTTTETFLRRANVHYQQNGQLAYKMVDRQLGVFNAKSSGTTETLKRLVPHYFIDVMTKDLVDGEGVSVGSISTNDNSKGIFGKPSALKFRSINYGAGASLTLVGQTVTQSIWQPAGEFDKFADTRLHFYNDGFTVHLVRKVAKGIKSGNTYYAYTTTSNAGLYPGGNEYYAVMDFDAVDPKHKEDAYKWYKRLNVVVKVCDETKGLEDNCIPYANSYKPEGLLQAYTKSNGMRFATFGYLNINGNGVDGGVLRSRMKKLIGDEKLAGEDYNTVYGKEWDTTTGTLVLNPDTTDATASNVENSGTINYLNKFGDRSGYKGFDPAGELYETALAYLRGPHDPEKKHVGGHNGVGIYKPADSQLTDAAKDGFPAIYDWDDPYKRGIEEQARHCHANSIIFIGDTNTHADDKVIQANPQASSYLQQLFGKEGISANTGDDFGSSNSPAYMAGLAYWARTNNIRPDLNHADKNPVNSNNFIIDVVEQGMYKASPMKNTYYLAAKYGGFNIAEKYRVYDLNKAELGQKPHPKLNGRDSWTDDGAGKTSISAFSDGVPRNFAVANNPKAMKDALGKAIASGAALSNPSQAATGLSTGLGDIVDVSETGQDYLLQSTYDFADLTGDVVIMKPVLQNGEINLTPTKYIGQILTAQYHGNTFATRKVFTVDKNNQAFDFTNDNASAIFDAQAVSASGAPSADKLRNYILGDNSLENGTLRQRKGLLGTVINSTATPILKAKQLSSCNTQFSDAALNRPVYYTAAANDGMLHIFDEEGQEQMAYMTRSALSKLPAFAKIGYQHQYLNDGTPVIQDVCLNDVAQTVLIGTTGRGGNAVYALNVTDISNPSTSNVMWELTDSDLGLTVSKPVITKGADGKQYAIVSSGFHTDGKASDNGYIFIVDIATGSYSKVKLGTAGVGAPFVYDGENDGIGDKIFVGDSDGKVWQLDSTGDAARPFAIPAKYNGQPLFTPYSSNARPITGAPYAEMVNGKLMVVAATGRYFSEKDLSTTQQNYAYGLIADEAAIVDTNNDSEILPQEILADITSTTDLDPSEKRVYSVTKNQMTDSHKGWRLKLLTGANVSADSLIRQRQVATFAYSRNTGDISATCVRGANSGLVQVDVRNGGLFPKALVDTNNDGRFDENDSPDVGMTENIGVNTPSVSFFKYRDEDGKVQSVALSKSGLSKGEEAWERLRNLEAQAGVRRISWREIF